jgi:hypothetical protein
VISCDAGRIPERSRGGALATILRSDCAALGSGAEPWRSFSDDTEWLRSSGFWSSSGAVEERQRGEFWTDCQVQLLLAAIILTGVGRSRSFMLSKVKIISAANGDMSPKLTRLQYPVRLAFGTSIDKG